MTEAEWFELTYPIPMLEDAPLSSDRKHRLFSVACCRRVWDHLCGAYGRQSVEVAEQYADGAATAQQLEQACAVAERGVGMSDTEMQLACNAARRSAGAASCALHASKLYADSVVPADALEAEWDQADSAESAAQADLLRDIFGNPFRPAAFFPEWRSDTAVALAAQMYESRDFSAMPILADALQDAGCDNADILTHCRDPHATHVRGCWVVDLVLGKE